MRLLSAAFLALAIAIATPASARQDDARLDKLFDTLQTTTNEREAQVVEARIWAL